ncbi:MAG: LuxR C-terminal-related transcriptional regulator [Rhizobium sp.]
MPGNDNRTLIRKHIVSTIQKAETLADICASAVLLQDHLGFDFYKIYAATAANKAGHRDRVLLSNISDAFFEAVDAIGNLAEEPEAVRTFPATQAFQWSTEYLRRAKATPGQLIRADLMDRFGMRRGVYFSLAPLDSQKRDLAFYGTREPLTDAELEDLGVLATHLLDRVNVLEERRDEDSVRISSLEMECLKMAAQGMETSQISRKLSLSVRTINYLLNSLCRKLGTETVEHAVAVATRAGYLR